MEAVGHHALDPSFFSDPHFESAAKTFQVRSYRSCGGLILPFSYPVLQDHLFSGWLTQKHHALVGKYLDGVREGTAHVPWKDETWERDHPEIVESEEDDDNVNVQDPSNFINIGRKAKK